MRKKAIINTLKGALLLFIFLFLFMFFSVKFCGLGDTIQPGAAPRKCEGITFKETFKYIHIIISFSLGMSIFAFLIMYPRNLQEEKKLAELKQKEEEEMSEKEEGKQQIKE